MPESGGRSPGRPARAILYSAQSKVDERFALFATVEISALGNSMDLGDLALPIQIR
jgi:hypothetical protein